MPTQRFLKLEEEKKRRILEAAKKEFSSYDYDKVSINRIIQESDISRGAFYTYFLDKDDLLVHLFEAEEDKAVRYFMEIMQRNQGDFFQSIQEWVIEIVKVRKKQIVQDSFAMFYRSGFLKNLSLASMRSHMDRGRRDNIDVVLEAIPKDYFPHFHWLPSAFYRHFPSKGEKRDRRRRILKSGKFFCKRFFMCFKSRFNSWKKR